MTLCFWDECSTSGVSNTLQVNVWMRFYSSDFIIGSNTVCHSFKHLQTFEHILIKPRQLLVANIYNIEIWFPNKNWLIISSELYSCQGANSHLKLYFHHGMLKCLIKAIKPWNPVFQAGWPTTFIQWRRISGMHYCLYQALINKNIINE